MSAQLLQAAMEEELLQSQLRSEGQNNSRKKRTKVTDTRLSPRTASKSNSLEQNPAVTASGMKPEFNLDSAAMASKAAFDGEFGFHSD